MPVIRIRIIIMVLYSITVFFIIMVILEESALALVLVKHNSTIVFYGTITKGC